MNTVHVYINGRIVPPEQAAISPFDIGLLRGYAVFDLLRTVGGKPFLLEEHLARLHVSASHLGLTVPVKDRAIRDAIVTLLELNAHSEATVRIVLTGGVSADGMSYDPSTPTLMILTHQLHEPPDEVYLTGGALITEEHLRELPEAKTTNYLTMLSSRSRLASEGAMDLLYCHNGHVLEAASASVHFVNDGVITSPAIDVLHGTVGALMTRLAAGRYPTRRAVVSMSDALTSDEIILTSTTRGVVPIVRLDGHPIGRGAPGPIARDLHARYRAVLEEFAASPE